MRDQVKEGGRERDSRVGKLDSRFRNQFSGLELRRKFVSHHGENAMGPKRTRLVCDGRGLEVSIKWIENIGIDVLM